MGKIIAVVSGKGGTGKTTAVGAIGACLGAIGKRTLCVDCDAELRNLDITLGVTNYVLPAFSTLTDLPDSVEELLLPHPSIENLFFMSPLDFTGTSADDPLLLGLFEAIRAEFDFCLLDAPAGVGADVLGLLQFADEAVIVTTSDRSSIRDGQVMCSRLQEFGLADISLLVNRVRPRFFRKAGLTVDDIMDMVGTRLLGIIREDDDVPSACNSETPLVLYSSRRAARGFLRVARRLNGENIPISEK